MFQWGTAAVKKEPEDAAMKPEPKPKKSKPKKKKPLKTERAADISSGEEEQKAKSNTRSKRPKRPRQPPPLGELPPGMLLVQADGFPEIRDLGKLIEAFPHMCSDLSKPDRCVGAKSGKDEKDAKDQKVDEDVKMSVKENPLSKPLDQVECQRRLDELPMVHPVVVDGQSWKHADKVRLLRQNRYYLPLLRASFESELLAASGTWKHFNGKVYDFPACKRGDKCVGMDGSIMFATADSSNGKPFKYVLTSLMLPAEYQQFLKDQRPPQTRLPCVACMRVMLVDAVCAFRGGKALVSEGKEVAELTMDEDMLLQSYRNLVDQPDGYYRDCCLEPSDEHWEGIISPIATFRESLLVARKGRYNRPYIDQSALIWTPGVTGKPGLGETIADFSTGVSS
jgi:hypothetical protein